MIEKRVESGLWTPVVETSIARVMLSKGPQQLVYSTKRDAEQRMEELERCLPVEVRRRGRSHRVVSLHRENADLPTHEWTENPSSENLAARRLVLGARLTALDAERVEVTREIDDLLSYMEVECTGNNHGRGCGKKTLVRELVYIQTHYYVEPHGCSGGDYWVPGEGNFDCPHCGHRNRLYDRKPIEALKRLFRGVTDEERD